MLVPHLLMASVAQELIMITFAKMWSGYVSVGHSFKEPMK